MSKTLLFFGNERILSGVDLTRSPILEQLIKDGYKILGVILNFHESKSRNQKTQATIELATAHDIPVYFPSNSNEIDKIVDELKPEAAILVAYGMIIPENTIKKIPDGIINVHPSLLPKYRGPSPIETAIINGDEKIGVSIMKLAAKMDAGPVYLQSEISADNLSKKQIAETILEKSAQMMHENLDKILSGNLMPIEQNDADATFTKKFNKEDSLLKPENLNSTEMSRLVVAYQDYPKPKIIHKNNTLIILKAHVESESDGLFFKCKDDKYLIIDELLAPNGKKMTGEAYNRGY